MTSQRPVFRVAHTSDDLLKVMSVRAIVFIEEQKCPYSIEVDGQDYSAVHLLGEINGEPISSGRIRFFNPFAKLERLAVRKSFRGRGYGEQMLQFMIQTAGDRGFKSLKLHAQTHATDFYLKHGFNRSGNKFMEAGIEHILMVREYNRPLA